MSIFASTTDQPPVALIGLLVMFVCAMAVTRGNKQQEDEIGLTWFSRFAILFFGIAVFFAFLWVQCRMWQTPEGVTYVIGILLGLNLLLPGVRLVCLGIQLLIYPPRNVGGGHDTGAPQIFSLITGVGFLVFAAYCVAWPWWPIH